MKMKHIFTGLIWVAMFIAMSAQAQNLSFDQKLMAIEQSFDHVNFEIGAKGSRVDAENALLSQTVQLAKEAPNRAEPLIWEAIILGLQAKDNGGIGALGLANNAKSLLEKSIAMNPSAMNAGGYASLGAMYSHVPGFPIAWGDMNKAKTYIEKALAIAPNDIDANYFYADVLYRKGDYANAAKFAQKALAAPARNGRSVGDAGRRREASALLKIVAAKGH